MLEMNCFNLEVHPRCAWDYVLSTLTDIMHSQDLCSRLLKKKKEKGCTKNYQYE